MMDEGDFPKQIALGARSVVWVRAQVEDWCAQKVSAALGWVMAKITIGPSTHSYRVTATFASSINDVVSEMKWVKEVGGTEEEVLKKYNLTIYR